MIDALALMSKPLVACLILAGIHAYLGAHVIERKVIFVDLALAQIAALGAVVGILFGVGLEQTQSYWLSLGATFIGAAIFAMTRTKSDKIPQEAIIGIVYAVSAAAAVLILSHSPEGDEEIRHMLTGNILLVEWRQILEMAVIYGCVGLVHWIFRKKFILISTDPDRAYKEGVSVRFWDVIFYLTFGLVVTCSVHIAGVLLVFSFLIVPAVAAVMFSEKIHTRLLLGWLTGALVSALGVMTSYYFDLPTGATVVCAFGLALIVAAVFRGVIR